MTNPKPTRIPKRLSGFEVKSDEKIAEIFGISSMEKRRKIVKFNKRGNYCICWQSSIGKRSRDWNAERIGGDNATAEMSVEQERELPLCDSFPLSLPLSPETQLKFLPQTSLVCADAFRLIAFNKRIKEHRIVGG
jgi:hypothetical protein